MHVIRRGRITRRTCMYVCIYVCESHSVGGGGLLDVFFLAHPPGYRGRYWWFADHVTGIHVVGVHLEDRRHSDIGLYFTRIQHTDGQTVTLTHKRRFIAHRRECSWAPFEHRQAPYSGTDILVETCT